jgi:8-oxo-dGTP diphosphatase
MARSEPKRSTARPTTVDAVVVKSGEILLIKRITYPHKGAWALPGGFVDQNETVEQAVVREVREETGLRTKIKSMLGVYSSPGRDPRKTISIAFVLKQISGRIRTSNETSDVKWFKLDGLPKLAFDHKQIIADAKKAV